MDLIVYRHGSNRANQGMTAVMPVGIYCVDAATPAERRELACEMAAAEHTVYANQWLSATPASRASAADRDAAQECQEAARRGVGAP